MILAAFMVLASAIGYFTFVSSMVYQESSSHLKEIYTQSNKAFNGIVSAKWKSLNDWLPYLEKVRNDLCTLIVPFFAQLGLKLRAQELPADRLPVDLHLIQ